MSASAGVAGATYGCERWPSLAGDGGELYPVPCLLVSRRLRRTGGGRVGTRHNQNSDSTGEARTQTSVFLLSTASRLDGTREEAEKPLSGSSKL